VAGPGTLLLVDDDPDIRRVATLSLERIGGWRVVAVGSGAEAVARAADLQPTGILLDVMMPGLDGPTTLTRLRENPRTRALPVILMTARIQPSEVARYHAMGVRGVLSKPFDPLALPGEVSALLDAAAL